MDGEQGYCAVEVARPFGERGRAGLPAVDRLRCQAAAAGPLAARVELRPAPPAVAARPPADDVLTAGSGVAAGLGGRRAVPRRGSRCGRRPARSRCRESMPSADPSAVIPVGTVAPPVVEPWSSRGHRRPPPRPRRRTPRDHRRVDRRRRSTSTGGTVWTRTR